MEDTTKQKKKTSKLEYKSKITKRSEPGRDDGPAAAVPASERPQ